MQKERSIVIFLILLMCSASSVYAQTRCITGRVIDDVSGRPVSDVHIYNEASSAGVLSDSLGRFLFCGIGAGDLIGFEHIAYYLQMISVDDRLPDTITIRLNQRSIRTGEVEIKGVGAGRGSRVLPGQATISKKEIIGMPAFLGEADVVKAIQTLPGVQTVSEGVGEVFVRGGAPGQNMILLDGMELMSPMHLMGLYSVFNPLLTQKAEVYKGHAPAALSERISSVISVVSVDPLRSDQQVMGSLGMLTSGLALVQHSKNQKWGVSVGARRSFLEFYEQLSKLVVADDKNYFNTSAYSFYDFNGRLVYQPRSSALLSFNWYLGADAFYLKDALADYGVATDFGNKAFTMDWKQQVNASHRFLVRIGYTEAWSAFHGNVMDYLVSFKNSHKRLFLQAEDLHIIGKHHLSWGVKMFNYWSVPQDMLSVIDNDSSVYYNRFRNQQIDVFVDDAYALSPQFTLYGGLRLHNYVSIAPDAFPDYSGSEYSESEWHQNKKFRGFSSSVSVQWQPQPHHRFKLAGARQLQMVHLASISSLPLPNDIWMMSTPFLKPQKGYQFSLGYYYERPAFLLTSEVFAKMMDNQVIFSVSEDDEVPVFEDHFFVGKGRAYGLEISGKKREGRFTGTVNYTWLRSERSFNSIDQGRWFRDKFDRTHDLALTGTYKLKEGLDFSAFFVLASGNNITLPSGRMWLMGTVMNDYDGYNNFRMPVYHRLDLSLTMALKSQRFKESTLVFSVMNVYNRANPYFLFYKVYLGDSPYDMDVRGSQVSLFPILPSIGWRFKF
ncbi:TonB-dependent receptor [Geofilum sp. OHC36d9]|uniref:TonB-dependent receptor n=1 Tax=Geofilum sp. OHC36d9 TaxID=3458413 RepID=UPI004034068B